MSVSRRNVVLGILALVSLGGGGRPALSDRKHRGRDDRYDDGDDDDNHEAAARARAAGEIISLTEILEHVRLTHPGEVVGIELEREGGMWIYELKLVTPQGRLLKIYVDARDKRVIKIEGK